ncbi:hypothetical protein Tco_1310508 [Tanacetum coccineum]
MASIGSSSCLKTGIVKPESNWENSDCWLTMDCEIQKVIHTVKIDKVRQIVDVKSSGKSADEIDKETMSFGEMQLQREDRSCVHASIKLHLHKTANSGVANSGVANSGDTKKSANSGVANSGVANSAITEVANSGVANSGDTKKTANSGVTNSGVANSSVANSAITKIDNSDIANSATTKIANSGIANSATTEIANSDIANSATT